MICCQDIYFIRWVTCFSHMVILFPYVEIYFSVLVYYNDNDKLNFFILCSYELLSKF